jgi:hypothetical protein
MQIIYFFRFLPLTERCLTTIMIDLAIEYYMKIVFFLENRQKIIKEIWE